MKKLTLILTILLSTVLTFHIEGQCTGALSLILSGSSTGGNISTTITAQPAAITTISLGTSVTLSVSVTGSNLTYQWWKDNVKLDFITLPSYTVTSAAPKDAGNYKVVVHGDCGNDITSEIALVQMAPLPLKWLSFKAKLTTENKVYLDWVTISEINVKHFLVERSQDGMNFKKISNPVEAKNAPSQNFYSITDEQPYLGVNLYRIVEIDYDGTVNYSGVCTVNNDVAEVEFKIFPNPTSSKSILSISTNYNENFDFLLTDFSGKIVYQAFKLKGNSVELSGINLMAGVYLYECRTNKKSVAGKIFVSQ